MSCVVPAWALASFPPSSTFSNRLRRIHNGTLRFARVFMRASCQGFRTAFTTGSSLSRSSFLRSFTLQEIQQSGNRAPDCLAYEAIISPGLGLPLGLSPARPAPENAPAVQFVASAAHCPTFGRNRGLTAPAHLSYASVPLMRRSPGLQARRGRRSTRGCCGGGVPGLPPGGRGPPRRDRSSG